MNNHENQGLNQYDPMQDPVDSQESYGKVDGHLYTTPTVVKLIPANDVAEVRKNAATLGGHYAAMGRIDSLSEYSDERWNEPIKYILNIAIGSMGALILGSGAALILGSSGRGVLGSVGGAMSGGVLAILGDNMLTKQVTRKRSHREARKALVNVEKQYNKYQPKTIFIDSYFQGQNDVINQVERNHLDDTPLWEMAVAMSINGAEGLVSFFLLLSGGLPLALAGAAFPIAVSMALAKTQSDHFDYPDVCERQIENYKTHLLKEQITASEALSITEVDETIKFVSSRSTKNPIKSVEEAKALGRVQFCSKRIATYRVGMEDEIKSLQEEFSLNRSGKGRALTEGSKQLDNEFHDAFIAMKAEVSEAPYSYQEPDVSSLPIDQAQELLEEHKRKSFAEEMQRREVLVGERRKVLEEEFIRKKELLQEEFNASILELEMEFSAKKDAIVKYYTTRIQAWEEVRQDAEETLNQPAYR